MNYIIEMLDINKSFPGVQALQNAQLKLGKGEVLGLIGENGAGKSTLMNILSGLLPMDSGKILLKGQEAHFKSPHDALQSGISMIHQELCLVQDMTVAENIWIGRQERFTSYKLLSRQKMCKSAQEILDRFDINIKSTQMVSSLSRAQMQLIEIIRSVSCESDVLIFDEPTSSLTNREIDVLFDIIKQLKQQGVSMIFISHKLEELMEICDRITVMRDAKYIDTLVTKDTNIPKLISLMVGRELSKLYQKTESELGDVALEVKSLTRHGYFNDINFKVYKGEILGISGLVGAGRTEIAQSIFGIDKYDSGDIYCNGKKVDIKSVSDAKECNMAMVPEERGSMGVIHGLSIKENITLASLKKFCKLGFMQEKREAKVAEKMAKSLSVKMASLSQTVRQLSGGNQQKVVLSKWLLTKPNILILDEPTRGIDVGSKAEIYRLMSELASQGMAIIMISSELPEILGMSDRILVIREGIIACELEGKDATQNEIMKYAFGNA